MPEIETPWEHLFLNPLTGGHNSALSTDQIDPSQSPGVVNLISREGRIVGDYGFSELGQALSGRPRFAGILQKRDGSSETLLVTNLTFYKWASAEWQYIAGDASTLVDGEHIAGSTSITVDDITDFADGDDVGITLDDGTQHQTTINGSPSGSIIVITDGIPIGRTVPDNAVFVKAVVLSGSDDLAVCMAVFPADDTVFIVNGVDNCKRYNSTNCIDIPNLVTGVGGGNCSAKSVLVQDNKCILFGTNENGSSFNQRVRWSATGDFTDWTATGDAGFEDLYGTDDKIIGAKKLGVYFIIYREKSVYRGSYVGSSALIYRFERAFDIEGGASTHSIVTRGPLHVVMGAEQMYTYDGGFEFSSFGEQVWETIYGTSRALSEKYKNRIFAIYLDHLHEYWFLVPEGDSPWPRTLWRYHVDSNSWWKRTFPYDITFAIATQLVTGVSWDSAVGTWNSTTWNIPWSDISLSSGAGIVLLGGVNSEGEYRVFQYTPSNNEDDGITIEKSYQTKNLLASQGTLRINRLTIMATGRRIVVWYSDNNGESWNPYGAFSVGDEWKVVDVWHQLTVEQIRFKIEGTEEIGLGWINIEYMEETLW